jgi:hypothetical protein
VCACAGGEPECGEAGQGNSEGVTGERDGGAPWWRLGAREELRFVQLN